MIRLKLNRALFVGLVVSLAFVTWSCQSDGAFQIELTSTAFDKGEMIPEQYTCDGKDTSPPLGWSNAPEGTKSFALICDDPDAPVGTWVHWVLYNIPGDAQALSEGQPKSKVLPNGATQGKNGWGKFGYGGPCPPSGKHRYYFKLYALSKTLELDPGASKAQLLEAMDGHVLAEGQLKGKYKRK